MFVYPNEEAAALDNFGIGSLTLYEAATLIAKCLYCNGDIQLENEVEVVALHDKKLEEALHVHIQFYQQKLLEGLEKGTLKASLMKRNIDDIILPDSVYLSCETLHEWLNDRDIDLGDLYHDDYLSELADIYKIVNETARYEMERRKNPELHKKFKAQKNIDSFQLYMQVRELEAKLAYYEAANKEKPLTTRTRETVLKLVIGMAVAGYRYKAGALRNSAVSDITSDLEKLGMPITDDTVRKWLTEACEFLPPQDGKA